MYKYLIVLIIGLMFLLSLVFIFRPGDKESESEEPGSGSTKIEEKHWILSVLFRKIEAGSFTMGSPSTEKDRDSDEDQVEVKITKPFEIMDKELTQKQWFLVKKENPSHFKTSEYCDDHEVVEGVEMCPNHPVENVSWDNVQDYIAKLNDSLKLTGCNGTPQDKSGCYRLPTEAEWEWAVRAGTRTAYFFGEDSSSLGKYAWYEDNSGGRTHKVGMKDASPNRLYDVYGNVWEWVQDGFNEKLPGGVDPLVVDSSPFRVFRGGRWAIGPRYLRSANRFTVIHSGKYSVVGFRLVRTL